MHNMHVPPPQSSSWSGWGQQPSSPCWPQFLGWRLQSTQEKLSQQVIPFLYDIISTQAAPHPRQACKMTSHKIRAYGRKLFRMINWVRQIGEKACLLSSTHVGGGRVLVARASSSAGSLSMVVVSMACKQFHVKLSQSVIAYTKHACGKRHQEIHLLLSGLPSFFK